MFRLIVIGLCLAVLTACSDSYEQAAIYAAANLDGRIVKDSDGCAFMVKVEGQAGYNAHVTLRLVPEMSAPTCKLNAVSQS